MSSGHALLPPSGAARWMRCPGSVALTNGLPDQMSDFADEGSVAHVIANRALVYHKPARSWEGEEVYLDWRPDKRWIVTPEMCDFVQVFVDYVYNTASEIDGIVLPEQRVQLDKTLGISDQGGTSDAVIYAVKRSILHVSDLKYGMGVKVDASYGGEINYQLGLYLLGTIETITDLFGPVEKLQVSVVQPRLDHISEFEITMDQLQAFALKARNAAHGAMMALTGDPTQYLHASEDACRWCPIKQDCPALAAYVAAEVAQEFGICQPITTGRTLGERWAAIPLIQQYIKAVEEATYAAVAARQQVFGPDGQPMKFVQGRAGHRKWVNEEVAGQQLALIVGPAAYEQPSVVSPAIADKLINKGKKKKTPMWDQVVAPLITQPPGAPILALGSDERPEYTSASAEEFAV